MLRLCIQISLLATVVVVINADEAVRKVTLAPFQGKHGTLISFIGLGTPTQITTMALDPSTPEFFIVNKECKTTDCTKNRQGYDTKASTSFVDAPGKPYETMYGGTKSTGRVITESFTALAIPGRDPPAVPLPMVDSPNGAFEAGLTTGVFGWGFLPEGSAQPATFLQVMTKTLDHQAWEYFIEKYTHTAKDKIETKGEVCYGNKDNKHCTESHFFIKSDNPRAWMVNVDYVRIGATKLSGGTAAFYPGAPNIYGPTAAVAAIRKRVHAMYDEQLKEWFVDCDKMKQAPLLRFVIHKRIFTYFPREYLVKSDDTNKCILLIQESNERYKGGNWILGDPLYREHCLYLDFNGGSPRIGFAKSKNNPNYKEA